MRKNKIIIAVAVLSFAAFAIAAYAAEPGSTGDPIALKSYVDSKISELEARLGGAGGAGGSARPDASAGSSDIAKRVDELSAAVDRLTEENASLRRSVRQLSLVSRTDADGVADRFEAIEVYAEQRIILGAGAEMVLRTGAALAIRGELGPIIDLITGADLDAGAEIPQNHILLSSRDDNRGVKITENAWVLLKGAYTIR